MEEDYWIVGGKLGWGIGGVIMVVMYISVGIFIGMIGVIYVVGWFFGWVLISIFLVYWFIVVVLVFRFISVIELMFFVYLERRY